jgi:hypothetical protein
LIVRGLVALVLTGWLASMLGCGGSGTPTEGAALYFVDVTTEAGLDGVVHAGRPAKEHLLDSAGTGAAWLDYDGDGKLDAYVVNGWRLEGNRVVERGANALYRNRGDGTFEDVTASSGAGDTGYGMGAAAADYDGDGDVDVFIANVGRNTLLRNDGDGRFLDATAEAGLGDEAWSSSAAWFDAEGDGDLDLYVVNYVLFDPAAHTDCGDVTAGQVAYCHPDAYESDPDVFYRNRGDGTFEVATEAAGMTDRTGKGLGVLVADFDADGDPDVYVANDSTPNFLYVNRGDGTFQEEGLLRGVSHNEDGATEAGMGVDAGDVDGDGWLDLVVTNLSHEANALYLGSPGGSFRYASRTRGLHVPSYSLVGFGVDLLDLDLDGDLDLYVANGHVIDNIEFFTDGLRWKQPCQVFWNEGGTFALAAEGSTLALSPPRVGRGSITLDFDNDGRLDVLQVFNGDEARLFHNVWTSPSSWIGLDLVATSGNRDAIGVRVTVRAGGREQVEEKRSGGSYQTSHDPRLHFGLGDARTCEVAVHWPDGDAVHRLDAGAYYRLVQGAEPVATTPPAE